MTGPPASNPLGVTCPTPCPCKAWRFSMAAPMLPTGGRRRSTGRPEAACELLLALTFSRERSCNLAPGPPKEPYQCNLQRNRNGEHCVVLRTNWNPNHLKRKLTSLPYFVRGHYHIHRSPCLHNSHATNISQRTMRIRRTFA